MIIYKQTDEFSAFGNIISVNAGVGVGIVRPITLISRTIPFGNQAEILKTMFRVIDDVIQAQIQFSIIHNGVYIYPWYKINGELINRITSIDINRIFDSGLLELVAHNISGTSESGASSESYDGIRCQGSWIGNLMSYDRTKIWES